MPGSSGSMVLNENNELSGLVFAGLGRDISYALIVPTEYIIDFLSKIKDTSDVYNTPWNNN